jgi:hypothetical protein
VTDAACQTATRIVVGVGDLVQWTRDDQAQGGYSAARRSRGCVTFYAVWTMHKETRSESFLVDSQNKCRRFVSCLASKSLGRFLLVWPQNRW